MTSAAGRDVSVLTVARWVELADDEETDYAWVDLNGYVRSTRVPVLLAYLPTLNPLAVHVIFDPYGPEPVEWTFARELLVYGMEDRAGLGDVRIWPHRHGELALTLDSPEESALFLLHRPTVAKFLRQTYAVVPRGREQLDFDRELAELLSDG